MKFRRLKNYFILALQYFITAIILYYIFTFINITELIAVFKSISGKNLFVILIISILIQYLHITRWGYILKTVDYKIAWMEILKSYFIGSTAGFISPGQIAEFFARKINLPNHSIAIISILTFVEKLYLLNSTIFLGSFGIFIFALTFLSNEFKIITGLILVFVIIISSIFIVTKLFYSLLLRFLYFFKKYFQLEIEELKVIDFTFPIRLRFFSNTLIIHLLIFYQFYYCIKLFANVNIFEVITGAASLYFLKTFIFFSGIGDLGVREGLAILIYGKYGIPTFVALTTSLLVFVFNLLLPALIGVIFLILNKFDIKR